MKLTVYTPDSGNRARVMINFYRLVLLCIGLLIYSTASAHFGCGDLHNGYGPFDYRLYGKNTYQRQIVESHHFTPEVEGLIKAETGQGHIAILRDIDYTLRAFPNHHRALNSMANYDLKYGIPQPSDFYTAECYFDRAMRMAPDDGEVRIIFGIYLQKKKEYSKALKQYKAAVKLMPKSSEAHYDLALLYIVMKQYELAKHHAEIAYKLGFPLPGLRDKLKKLGYWNPK